MAKGWQRVGKGLAKGWQTKNTIKPTVFRVGNRIGKGLARVGKGLARVGKGLAKGWQMVGKGLPTQLP